jgi:hypothetical protein
MIFIEIIFENNLFVYTIRKLENAPLFFPYFLLYL